MNLRPLFDVVTTSVSVKLDGVELPASHYSVSKDGVITFAEKLKQLRKNLANAELALDRLKSLPAMQKKVDTRPYYRRFSKR